MMNLFGADRNQLRDPRLIACYYRLALLVHSFGTLLPQRRKSSFQPMCSESSPAIFVQAASDWHDSCTWWTTRKLSIPSFRHTARPFVRMDARRTWLGWRSFRHARKKWAKVVDVGPRRCRPPSVLCPPLSPWLETSILNVRRAISNDRSFIFRFPVAWAHAIIKELNESGCCKRVVSSHIR